MKAIFEAELLKFVFRRKFRYKLLTMCKQLHFTFKYKYSASFLTLSLLLLYGKIVLVSDSREQ